MIPRERVERVFAHRTIPAEVVDMAELLQLDDDVEDAIWFTGRDWRDITWADWKEHYCSFYFFAPGAFAYYLPSILLLSAQNPNEDLLVADSLISQLDRTPNPEWWEETFVNRFFELNIEELALLKEWLVELCKHTTYMGVGISGSGPGDRFGRAYDTVNFIQQETKRRMNRIEDAH
jgi:hypothetical protein